MKYRDISYVKAHGIVIPENSVITLFYPASEEFFKVHPEFTTRKKVPFYAYFTHKNETGRQGLVWIGDGYYDAINSKHYLSTYRYLPFLEECIVNGNFRFSVSNPQLFKKKYRSSPIVYSPTWNVQLEDIDFTIETSRIDDRLVIRSLKPNRNIFWAPKHPSSSQFFKKYDGPIKEQKIYFVSLDSSNSSFYLQLGAGVFLLQYEKHQKNPSEVYLYNQNTTIEKVQFEKLEVKTTYSKAIGHLKKSIIFKQRKPKIAEIKTNKDAYGFSAYQEKENSSSFQPYSKTSIDSLTAFALTDEQAVKQIIEKEYPIHFDVICQRMSSRCGKSILMIDVVERTRKALLNIKADVKYSEGFFCPNNNDHISARQSGGRPLKYISKEELLAGINELSRRGVPKDQISNQLKKEMCLEEDMAVIEALVFNYLQK